MIPKALPLVPIPQIASGVWELSLMLNLPKHNRGDKHTVKSAQCYTRSQKNGLEKETPKSALKKGQHQKCYE